MADNTDAEGQFRPLEAPAPDPEAGPDAPPVQIDIEPIREPLRRILRQEITIVRNELRQEIRQEIRAELHIGPLPHENTVAGYERIVPGSAEKIINAFVAQGEHRQQLESFALKWDTVRSFAGLAAGFIISIIVMFLAYDLIRTGHETAGTILASIDLVGLVAIFIYGTHVIREERIKKARIMVSPQETQKREVPKELSE